jgi:hypothetical protein
MIDTDIRFYATASDEDKKIFRNWLVSHLKMGEVRLTFNKKDGTIREMKATLDQKVVPIIENTTGTEKKRSPEVVSVWDMEKSAWRSVRFDSIMQISF